MVIVVFGLPGSGKSYFAKQLCDRISGEYLSSDGIRNTCFQEKEYSENGKKRIYEKLMQKIQESCLANPQKTLVVDATFYLKELREALVKKMDVLKQEVLFIEIVVDTYLIEKRTSVKRVDSDADFLVAQQVAHRFESMKEKHLVLESKEDNIEKLISQALTALHLHE
jgi:predicted kinase